MYCVRRSALRKYTLAALNGESEGPVPETLASPESSDWATANEPQARMTIAKIHLAARMRAPPQEERIYALIGFQPSLAHHISPFRDLPADVGSEFFGSTGKRIGAHPRQTLLEVGRLHGLD